MIALEESDSDSVIGRDLRQGPRTLDALGLASLSRGQLQTLLRTGATA